MLGTKWSFPTDCFPIEGTAHCVSQLLSPSIGVNPNFDTQTIPVASNARSHKASANVSILEFLGKWCPGADSNHRHADFQEKTEEVKSETCDRDAILAPINQKTQFVPSSISFILASQPINSRLGSTASRISGVIRLTASLFNNRFTAPSFFFCFSAESSSQFAFALIS